jgi:hypothetical protein
MILLPSHSVLMQYGGARLVDVCLSPVQWDCDNIVMILGVTIDGVCRSHWPRGLRHELSLLARTWVQIPLKAWMSLVCAFILLCCSVCR